MNLQSAETSRVVLVGGVTAEIGIESSLAGAAASFIGNDSPAQRARPIELEAVKMSCPRCQHIFPVEFYCIVCGYVPTVRNN